MRYDHQTNCLACLAGEKNQQGVWGFEEHQRGWKWAVVGGRNTNHTEKKTSKGCGALKNTNEGGNVQVAEVNTSLKINNWFLTPRLFATPSAILNFDGLNSVTENEKHFQKSFLQTDGILNVRDTANIQTGNVLFRAKGPMFFTILQKTKDNIGQTWFNIKWKDKIVVLKSSPPNNVVETKVIDFSSGDPDNGWIRPNFDVNDIFDRVFYPVASFEKFITDFSEFNRNLDIHPDSQNDSLAQRITRIRQMTKEEGTISELFDKLIAITTTLPDPPLRLNNLYDAIPTGTHSNLELFTDYMGVEMSNGRIIDLHHLFVGLDVLNHPLTNISVTLFGGIVSETISDNIDITTWAGDIGAAPADYKKDDLVTPFGNNDDKGADDDYEDDWIKINPGQTTQNKEAAFKLHYYKTRAKDEDMITDIYAHLINKNFLTYLIYDGSFKNITAALYYFNLKTSQEGDKSAFIEFVRYLGFDSSFIPFKNQISPFNNVVAKIEEFSELWYRRRFSLPSIIQITTNTINNLTESSTNYAYMFLNMLEKNI